MKFLISCIGKQKPGPEYELVSLYTTRIQKPFSIREFETKPTLPVHHRKQFEAEKLLSPFSASDYIIALDERGKNLTSHKFAQMIEHAQNESVKTMGFIIGGADGLDDSVKKRADCLLSLGALTWPHMLVRPLIAEQIYRGLCILSNHPYHRN